MERPLHICTLAVPDDTGLRTLAQHLADYLANHAHKPIADICFTLNRRMPQASQRLACPAATTTQLSERLQAFVQSEAEAEPVQPATLSDPG